MTEPEFEPKFEPELETTTAPSSPAEELGAALIMVGILVVIGALMYAAIAKTVVTMIFLATLGTGILFVLVGALLVYAALRAKQRSQSS
jgi:hypothetical protein